MTTILQLSNISTALILSLFFVVFTGLTFLIIIRWMRLGHLCFHLLPLLGLLLISLDLLYLLEIHKSLPLGRPISLIGNWLGNLSWIWHIMVLTLAGLYCLREMLEEKRIAATTITLGSIREALENLPSALCFSGENGLPLLTNRSMYRLSEELTGHILLNIGEFWQELSQLEGHKHIKRIQAGSQPIFHWTDGTIRQFSQTRLLINGEPYLQTTATDITRLYNLSQELAQNNVALDHQHSRLKKLTEEIVNIKREEEILLSKAKIHDQLGHCVLTSRRFLVQPDGEAETILALWQDVIEKLEISAYDSYSNGDDNKLGQLLEAAATLDCAIEFDGVLPENQKTTYLLLTAVREAVTNAVRHAEANQVTVRLTYTDKLLTATITDNGTNHPTTITEGGGLTNLRYRVEQAGGEMKTLCNYGVQLHLQLDLTEKEK